MAIVTVTVEGKILKLDGSAGGGRLEISLQPPSGAANDGGTTQLVAGKFTTIVEADGTVAFEIIANDIIVPSGSQYRATFRPDVGEGWVKYWEVASTPDPVDIGDIPEA